MLNWSHMGQRRQLVSAFRNSWDPHKALAVRADGHISQPCYHIQWWISIWRWAYIQWIYRRRWFYWSTGFANFATFVVNMYLGSRCPREENVERKQEALRWRNGYGRRPSDKYAASKEACHSNRRTDDNYTEMPLYIYIYIYIIYIYIYMYVNIMLYYSI